MSAMNIFVYLLWRRSAVCILYAHYFLASWLLCQFMSIMEKSILRLHSQGL